MRILEHKLFRYSAIAACSVIVASGCVLDRSPILPGWATLEPMEYCAGDTLRASYDLLRSDTCPAGVDCSPFLPNVTISSGSGEFSPTPFRAYAGNVGFTPAGDASTVTFDIDRDNVLIPTDRFEGGNRVFLQRTNLRDTTLTARRITGARETTHMHPGMCSGASPVNAPAELPGPPRTSANLRLTGLCNANGVPVNVTLSGGAPGVVYSQDLMPGECIDTGMPGVPAGVDASRMVEIRPLIGDPSTRCTATGPNNPPPTLRTLARMACR
ncbi:MAG: hypothetical protein KF800_08800 [Lysobacter sp.]|nr:hypothetical protein [Lysobacter sp.]